MNLATLKSKLDTAKTGTGVTQVVFDYTSYLNYGDKAYPLALWDIGNAKGVDNDAEDTRTINIDCWILNLTTPENDIVNRELVWDAIWEVKKKYMASVNIQGSLSVENIRSMSWEHFPAGLMSIEREMAILYKVELKLWCYTAPVPEGD